MPAADDELVDVAVGKADLLGQQDVHVTSRSDAERLEVPVLNRLPHRLVLVVDTSLDCEMIGWLQPGNRSSSEFHKILISQ